MGKYVSRPFRASGEIGGNQNPGLQPGLRYFAPLGLNLRPTGTINGPLGLNQRPLGLNQRALGLRIVAGFSATSKHLDVLSPYHFSARGKLHSLDPWWEIRASAEGSRLCVKGARYRPWRGSLGRFRYVAFFPRLACRGLHDHARFAGSQDRKYDSHQHSRAERRTEVLTAREARFGRRSRSYRFPRPLHTANRQGTEEKGKKRVRVAAAVQSASRSHSLLNQPGGDDAGGVGRSRHGSGPNQRLESFLRFRIQSQRRP